MQIHPKRLSQGLWLCLSGFLITGLSAAAHFFGLLEEGISILGLPLAFLALVLGAGLCARATAGAPRAWAVATLLLCVTGMLTAWAQSAWAFFCVFGFLVTLPGLILSLSRVLGDATTASVSRRAIGTSIMVPLLCIFGGLALESSGLVEGLGFGLVVVGVCGGPILFSCYLAYLIIALLPRVNQLKDGETVESRKPGELF